MTTHDPGSEPTPPMEQLEGFTTGEMPEVIPCESDPTGIPPCDRITDAVHLTGMYRSWFLDYASYVILERAVPHIDDGLKPVQRRVLFALYTMRTDRMTKVAKVVGATMAYHPHGDASINDALVQIGQKGYLIDMQGNWGNILTGDGAAAGRYIEARLSAFAREILFNDKITRFKRTYDGSADEPTALPVKFPLLLLQGAEGIAVGLSAKILPHNFNEIVDAACAHLRGEAFCLLPDFPTGGMIDAAQYNDGQRGGRIKSRARIVKLDNRTLSIVELPAGKTTTSLIDSILKANEKGKIKIRRVDDMTAAQADIRIHLPAGVSSDKTIDALYALTDCETNISPNVCVIEDDKPVFTSVSELLRHSVNRTRVLLQCELRGLLEEKQEAYLGASLERIFIEERIYKDKEFEEAVSEAAALRHIDTRIEPWEPQFIRPIKTEDLKKLLEIRMARILRFNLPKHEQMMLALEHEIAELRQNIQEITHYTIRWFEHLREQYGAAFPRRTQVVNFYTIEAAKVVELDQKLYINREEGFVGTGLKNDEYICACSDLDDIILFFRDGGYMITKVEEKKFIGNREVVYLDRYERGNERTVYNIIYREGKKGPCYIKRFNAMGMVRDREYNMTQESPESRIMYFTANKNAEAEMVRVILKRKPRQRVLVFEKDFSEVLIKGRAARGNLLTRADVQKVILKEAGTSTLGARRVWFDPDVQRLNYESRGRLIGSFRPDDKLLVMLRSGDCYTTGFDENNRFESDLCRVELYRPSTIWTAVYHDTEQGYTYVKRFTIEEGKREHMVGSNNRPILITDTPYPRFELKFGTPDAHRLPVVIDVQGFIGVKSIYAKGKRLSNFVIESVNELEPLHRPDAERENIAVDESPVPERVPVETREAQISIDELNDELQGIQRLQFEEDENDEA